MSYPYEIKLIYRNDKSWAIIMAIGNLDEILHTNKDYKPILRPLSDLTKEIEHKGEKFNPSCKLGLETISGIKFYKLSNSDLEINIETPNYSTQIDLYSGFLIVQKLIEWHFDIADLISKGEAIDVNTLGINPYK